MPPTIFGSPLRVDIIPHMRGRWRQTRLFRAVGSAEAGSPPLANWAPGIRTGTAASSQYLGKTPAGSQHLGGNPGWFSVSAGNPG